MSKDNATMMLRQHLENLTKEELIRLIMQLAPPSFREAISSQYVSDEAAQTILEETSGSIKELFTNEELLYDPEGFERELVRQLDKLRGLWLRLPVEMGELLINLIEAVEQAFEDGYLYIEQYGREDEYFESEAVNVYIFQFVSSLPQDMQGQYIEQLQELLEVFGYTTFWSLEQRLTEF